MTSTRPSHARSPIPFANFKNRPLSEQLSRPITEELPALLSSSTTSSSTLRARIRPTMSPYTSSETDSLTAEMSSESDIEDVKKFGIKTYEKDGKKMIYGGTIEKIVSQLLEWLITDYQRNDIFRLVNIFLCGYKRYYTPEYLLQLLIDFWSEEGDKPDEDIKRMRTSIVVFLSYWFEIQFSDFSESPQLLETFMKNMTSEYRKPLISKIQSVHKVKPRPIEVLFDSSKDSKQSKLEPGKFGLLDLKPQQIADQWTILDMKNFLSIKREEFMKVEKDCVNWDRMMRRAAMLTRWVASEIVQVVERPKRVEVMRRFVLLAWALLENKNFNGLMCVWGGLNTVAVHRLTKTKKRLPKQVLDVWAALEEKLSEAQNFGRLRKAIQKQLQNSEPTVPWFELINKLRNWADQYDDFISVPGSTSSASATTTTTSGSVVSTPRKTMYNIVTTGPLINFSKLTLLGDQLTTFEKYKKNLEKVDLSMDGSKTDAIVRSYLEHLPTYDDDVLWKFSHQCEPDTK
eukprot:TRINITY_DN2925_c0_g2_i3.p1 TRINITY_DN2925_c0_g2~~TRINITY_DN2925_c0_g2_i3.p1  ORF type:complete len:515 (+),score=103.27 TRINITY_DN2925_c0_g2_i3:256-1800(+)